MSDKLAQKFQEMANNLSASISSRWQRSEINTFRKLDMKRNGIMEGVFERKVQEVLFKLADAYVTGNVPAELAAIKSKKEVEDLVRRNPDIFKPLIDLSQIDIPTDLSNWLFEGEIALKKIPGYFPTPRKLIETRLYHMMQYHPGERILDPNAGSGSLLSFVREKFPECSVHGYEINWDLYMVCKNKGFDIGHMDFLDCELVDFYDHVLMNPPFEKFQDIDHIRHAFNVVKPGGTVLAIASRAVQDNSAKKAKEFREWVTHYGFWEELPDKSFMDSDRPTAVATVLVYLEKPLVTATEPVANATPVVEDEPETLPTQLTLF